jgi:hypothetical protein
MSWIEEILTLDVKSKEKVELFASKLKSDGKAIADLVEFSKTAPTAAKGHCVEAITLATEHNPKLAGPYMPYLVELTGDKTPRVKWEACHAVANAAKEFPEQAAKAIPTLLANTKDGGTVVKWSTALALTEIAKHDTKSRAKLLPVITELSEKESGGVQKIYLKALKALQKG